MSDRPAPPRGIAFGGDYNPEQWPRETWAEDVRLMGEAGVDLVNAGILSWALPQPEPDRFDFDWLDEVLGTLHAGGVRVDDGGSADQWTELVHLDGAQAVSSYVDGALAGVPAVTRHDYGRGSAWYVATRMDPDAVARLTARVVAEAGIEPVAGTVPGVEVVRRRGDATSYLFVLSHTAGPATVPAHGVDLLTGQPVTGKLNLAAGDVAVIREDGG